MNSACLPEDVGDRVKRVVVAIASGKDDDAKFHESCFWGGAFILAKRERQISGIWATMTSTVVATSGFVFRAEIRFGFIELGAKMGSFRIFTKNDCGRTAQKQWHRCCAVAQPYHDENAVLKRGAAIWPETGGLFQRVLCVAGGLAQSAGVS